MAVKFSVFIQMNFLCTFLQPNLAVFSAIFNIVLFMPFNSGFSMIQFRESINMFCDFNSGFLNDEWETRHGSGVCLLPLFADKCRIRIHERSHISFTEFHLKGVTLFPNFNSYRFVLAIFAFGLFYFYISIMKSHLQSVSKLNINHDSIFRNVAKFRFKICFVSLLL